MQQQDYSRAEQLYAELIRLAPNVPEVYSNLGLARYRQKKFKPAADAFQSALRLKPDLFVPNLFLGKIHFEEGHYKEAIAFLEKVIGDQPQEKVSRRLFAAALFGLKRYDEAVAQHQKLLREDPADVESLYSLGRIYLDLGQKSIGQLLNYKNTGFAPLVLAEHDAGRPGWQTIALEKYREAVAALPNVPGPRVALGNLLLKSETWQSAKEVFQAELGIDPFSHKARYGLAQVVLREGNLDAAVHYLDEAVCIRPEHFDPLPELPTSSISEQGQSYYSRAEGKSRQESFGAAFLLSTLVAADGLQARAALWRFLAEQKRDKLIQDYELRFQQVSQKLRNENERRGLGLKLIHEKRYEEGLRLILPLVEEAQCNPEVTTDVVRALFALQRFEDIIKLLKGMRPNDPESFYLLASSYKKLGLRTMERMVETNPQSSRAHQLLGDSYFAQEMFQEAAREYEAALKIHPSNPELNFTLGNAFFKQMKFDLAGGAYSRAIELNPFHAEAHLMRGYGLVVFHRPTEAIPYLQRALELDANLVEAHAQLGKALAQMGQREEAVRHLEIAARIDEDGSLHYQLFHLYRKLGELEKAKQALVVSEKIRRESQETQRVTTGKEENSGKRQE